VLVIKDIDYEKLRDSIFHPVRFFMLARSHASAGLKVDAGSLAEVVRGKKGRTEVIGNRQICVHSLKQIIFH
jgi:hypothetical protein